MKKYIDAECEETTKQKMELPKELYIHKTLPDGRIVTYCTMRQQVLHCIGLVDSGSQRHKPYSRHGKTFYRPWRNYFSAPFHSTSWDELCEHGYAEHNETSDRGVMYWITRKGLDWIGEQLGITIHNEED